MRALLNWGYFRKHRILAASIAPHCASESIATKKAHYLLFAAAEWAAQNICWSWNHVD